MDLSALTGLRSIPACAGEPRGAAGSSACRRVHPRLRGGADLVGVAVGEVEGPSPPARGSRAVEGAPGASPGSIPACAGEPDRARGAAPRGAVHPRLRGGALGEHGHGELAVGPSPPARGSPRGGNVARALRGSIPACAGEPSARAMWIPTSRVHPRLRGGARGAMQNLLTATGPSPPARGSQTPGGWNRRGVGSIPACAGEPRATRPWPSRRRVHPRLRGGAARVSAVAAPSAGPSPPARGSPASSAAPRAAVGSIPACAGEPSCIARWRTPGWVHPRLRGGARRLAARITA